MVIVDELTKTCDACPAQWEGKTRDGRGVYVRFRWGYLSVRVSEDVGGDGVKGEEVFGKRLDESGWLGVLGYDELQAATRGVVSWPIAAEEAKAQ